MSSWEVEKLKCGREPRLLVVLACPELRQRLMDWLGRSRMKVAVAKTASEALEMLRDARFIEFPFDGLITTTQLPNASGWRVIREFRSEYPDAPVAAFADDIDPAVQMWMRLDGVEGISEAEGMNKLFRWLERLRAVA